MNGVIITNNPMVEKKYSNIFETVFLENTNYFNVLLFTRNKIHEGHKLLTHPLSGSVKPNQTPYKSIILTKEKGKLDIESLKIMEESIEISSNQIYEKQVPIWPREILEDFQLIDMNLISSGIESMVQF